MEIQVCGLPNGVKGLADISSLSSNFSSIVSFATGNRTKPDFDLLKTKNDEYIIS